MAEHMSKELCLLWIDKGFKLNGRWAVRKTYDKHYPAYMDGGLEPAKRFIIENLAQEIEIASKNVGLKDYKTVLQEKLQIHGDVKIEYTILSEKGPDHDKTFEAQVSCNNKKLATGIGKTKKQAEMKAAEKALEVI